MRHVLLSLAVVAMSSSAFAHPEPEPLTKSQDFNLPSQTEIEEMIDRLPDFNAIIGDVIELTENDRLQKRMERSGEAFSDKLEESGALEPDENGIPDIKLALKVMMSVMSDEEVTGGMIETLSELQSIMEKHVPEAQDGDPIE